MSGITTRRSSVLLYGVATVLSLLWLVPFSAP